MRVSEAFAAAGIQPPVTDGQFSVTCDECCVEQTLDAMPLSEVLDVTIYACSKCGRSLVGVKPWKEDATPRERSGYRLDANVVAGRADVILQLPGGATPVLLPAAPVFFE